MSSRDVSELSPSNGSGGNAPHADVVTLAPGCAHAAERLRDLAGEACTGIDAQTGLASDYLNQFNEVSMILDMACEDSEMIEELDDWAPQSYADHFRASQFRDLDLILEAYELSPKETRDQFEAQTAALGDLIVDTVRTMRSEPKPADIAADASRAFAAQVREQIDALSAIIHPTETAPSADDISALFAAKAASN